MLSSEIPDDAPTETKEILAERLPNYCGDCGQATVLAGGWQRLTPGRGLWYDHIDVVLSCPSACFKHTFMGGVDRDEGLQHYVDNEASKERHSALFSDVVGYCEHHGRMQVTKDIAGTEGPLRQYKCGECERGMAVLYTG